MVENYTKDLKKSVYHGAVVSVLAIGYTMLGKTLTKMSPPSLSKFDVEDGIRNIRYGKHWISNRRSFHQCPSFQWQ